MKPQIAISMSRDGIEVFRRMADGWRATPLVPLDDPGFSARVRAAYAEAQSAGGASAEAPDPGKLIIPGTEILYTSVHAPGPGDSDRQQQIARAIDGMTPYAVDDLVFDWCGIGDDLQVAVVARDTLEEAEAFAVDHGIDAVGFVAAPQSDQFMGEVYFGRTQMAARLLPRGSVIERDESPVRVVGPLADAPPLARDDNVAPPSATSDESAGQGGAPQPVSATDAPPTPLADAPGLDDGAKGRTDAPPDKPKLPEKSSKRRKSTQKQASVGKEKDGPPASLLPWLSRSREDGAARLSGQDARKVEDADHAPAAQFTSRRSAVATDAQKDKAPVAAKPTPPPSATAAPAPAGRAVMARLGELGKKLVPARAPQSTNDTDIAVAPSTAADPVTGKLVGKARALLKRTQPGAMEAGDASARAADPSSSAKPVPWPRAEQPTTPAPEKATVPQPNGQASAVTGSIGGAELKQALAAPVRNLADKSGRKSPSAEAAGTEAEKLTIFGARGSAPAERGFVGRGLMLTGALVLVLAAVAVWAVFFLTDPEPGVQLPATAVPPASQQAAAPEGEPGAAPVFDEDAQIDAALPELEADGTPPEAATPPETSETVETGELAAAPGDLAAEMPATEMPEVRGIPDDPALDGSAALRTDSGTSSADPFAISSLTPPSSSAAQMPEAPMAPAPFGTEEIPGMLSSPDFAPPPDVIEGRPAAVPPPRPEGLAPDQDAQLAPAPSRLEGDIQLASLSVEGAQSAPARAVPPQAARAAVRSEAATPETAPEIASVRAETETVARAVQAASLLGVDDNTAPGAAPTARAAQEAVARAQGVHLFTEAASEFEGARPVARPASLIVPQGALASADETATPQAEAAPSGDTGTEAAEVTATPGGLVLTALRPAARPDDLVTRPADPASSAGSAVVIESDNPLAVAASLRPNQRPENFARRVQQAIAAAQAAPRQQAAAPRQQAAAAPTPSATPSIPTSASVAREATQARAINLRQVNLIGVFGTSSSRTALVRLSNGRIERVRVGDRLDRGQVTAIGDSELVYQRSGRSHRLRVAERG